MKQTVEPAARNASRSSELAASRAAHLKTDEPGGRMAQLAAMMNDGSSQRLVQLRDDIQRSPHAQSLTGLAAEINQGVNPNSNPEREAEPMGPSESISLSSTAQLKIDIFGTLAHGDRGGDERTDAHASQPKNECGCGAKQDKSSGKQRKDPPRGNRPVQKKAMQQQPSDASRSTAQLEQSAPQPVTSKPVRTHGQEKAEPARSRAGNRSSSECPVECAAFDVRAQRKLAEEIQNSGRMQAQGALAFEINQGGAAAGQAPVAQAFTGQIQGSGVAQRTKVAQLGRSENLDHQFEIEEALFSKAKRAKFIKEFSALIAQVQKTFPELAEVDAATVSGGRFDKIKEDFHTATMDNEALNSDTEAAYKPLVEEQRQSALQRLSIPAAETVAGRAGDWKTFKEFRPTLNPLNLLLGPELFAELKAETEKKIQAKLWLISEVPSREDFIGRTVKSFTFTGQEPSPDIATDAGEFYNNAKVQINSRYHALDKTASSESFEGEITKIHKELVVPLKTALSQEAVGKRQQTAKETKGGEQIKGFALVSPDFDLRMMNLKWQNHALEWLAKEKKPEPFKAALKKLYPKLMEKSEALNEDLETFFQEQMAAARGQIYDIALDQPEEDYNDLIKSLLREEILPLFEIPQTPRQFVSGPLTEEPLGKLYGELADELAAEKNITVLGASDEEETRLIKHAVVDHSDLRTASEKRIVVQVPAGEGTTQRLNVALAMDEKNAITATVVTRGAFSVPDSSSDEPQVKIQSLKETLKAKYGLAGFEEEKALWQLVDLARLQQALTLLPAEDLPALKGLVFVRAASLDKDEEHEQGRTLGLYSGRPTVRKIKFADIAFAADKAGFSKKGPQKIQPASYRTIFHEIAHAIDKHAMLEAQKERELAFDAVVGANLFGGDPLVDEADRQQSQAESAQTKLMLTPTEVVIELGNAKASGEGFLSTVRQFLLACTTAAKTPLELPNREFVSAKEKLKAVAVEMKRWPALEKSLTELEKLVMQLINASRWLHEKKKDVESAKEKSKAGEASRKENLKEKEQKLKEASAESPKLKDKSRRLEKFVAFVETYDISPKITPYAEQSWKEGKYWEFFAEAYSLFLAEPEFLRKNYQPLFLYFQTGEHRK